MRCVLLVAFSLIFSTRLIAACEKTFALAESESGSVTNWDRGTKAQLDWLREEASKKYPKLCLADTASANFVIIWSDSVNTRTIEVPVLKTETATQSGTIYGSGGGTATYSGSSTIYRYETKEVERSTLYVIAWLYRVEGQNRRLSGPLYSSTHAGNWRWSKPDKDVLQDVLKFLAQSNPSPSTVQSISPPAVIRKPVATPSVTAPTNTPSRLLFPGGAQIMVRMIDPVDSSLHQIGQTFRASLDMPMVVNGQTIAAKGADVTAKLTKVEQSGRMTGKSELTLVLLDITIDGRKHEITTSEVSEAGTSLGAAVQVLTKGGNVQIPAESRLIFTLKNSLYQRSFEVSQDKVDTSPKAVLRRPESPAKPRVAEGEVFRVGGDVFAPEIV
ncbi:MAG: hypothetical protein HY313_02425 [Acidobacteria bacterium]|nr:hypothetical protein [Acidobacteriota bacterium]